MDSKNRKASTKPRQYIGRETRNTAENHDHQMFHSTNVICIYHRLLLDLKTTPSSDVRGLHPMQRFMMESPLEQPTVFARPDTGRLSISRNCICSASITENILLCFEDDISAPDVLHFSLYGGEKDERSEQADRERSEAKVLYASRRKC